MAIVVAGGLYLAAVLNLRLRGHRWPLRFTLLFVLLGLGSYAWICFGFLGTYSVELRWAFTTKIALLLFAVPALLALGKPIELAQIVLRGFWLRALNGLMKSWPVRLFGNAIFAPIFAMSLFLLFITPLAAGMRQSELSQDIITIAVPLLGLFMVLPIASHNVLRTSLFITAEFMLAFVELVLDAIPGILLRLNDAVLDHATPVIGTFPSWFPNALHDQHLSGDFLWFIAEIADIPVLIILFIRWSHTDKREAKKMDDLSDEEMDELLRAHLRGPADQTR